MGRVRIRLGVVRRLRGIRLVLDGGFVLASEREVEEVVKV